MRLRLLALAAVVAILMSPGALPAQDLGPVIIGGEQPWQPARLLIVCADRLDELDESRRARQRTQMSDLTVLGEHSK